jgi:hypothetical protein
VGKSSRIGPAAVLALALLAPAGLAEAQSGGGGDAQSQAERLAREGVEKLLKALDLMLQSVPQYEAPTINENGDIVIRRKHPGPQRKPSTGDDSKT